MRLDEGWNQIQFNLGDFTSRAYNTVYIETLRVQIHASCRIRRIFFSSRLYEEEELPPGYKIWVPGKDKAPEQHGHHHGQGDYQPEYADEYEGQPGEYQGEGEMEDQHNHEEGDQHDGDDGGDGMEDQGGEDDGGDHEVEEPEGDDE